MSEHVEEPTQAGQLNHEEESEFDAIVIGAGAAGVGAAIALIHAGIGNFAVFDRQEVGASFAAWPAETRFITPSFPTNSIGMVDINSIAPGASPDTVSGLNTQPVNNTPLTSRMS